MPFGLALGVTSCGWTPALLALSYDDSTCTNPIWKEGKGAHVSVCPLQSAAAWLTAAAACPFTSACTLH